MGMVLVVHTLYGYQYGGIFRIGWALALAAMIFVLLGSFGMFTGLILNSIAMYIANGNVSDVVRA